MTFGYDAQFKRALVENTTSINAIAETLVSRLVDARKEEFINRPLVLVAHSLGGLVIKKVPPYTHITMHSLPLPIAFGAHSRLLTSNLD